MRRYFCLLFLMLTLCLGGCGATKQTVSYQTNQSTEDCLQVHYMDVGHGDAILIRDGQYAMLVDCGKSIKASKVIDYTKKQGVEVLDYLILTHPDNDHIGGAPSLLNCIQVQNVFTSAYIKDSAEYEQLQRTCSDLKIEPVTPQPGQQFTLEQAVITFLGPVQYFDSSNNSSLVFRLDYGETSFLFTGDQEKKAEKALLAYLTEREQLELLQANVWKVAHHGKNDASKKEFVDAVNSQYAIISCGLDDGDKEPEDKLLERLAEGEMTVLRTDLNGTIVAKSDGKEVTFYY